MKEGGRLGLLPRRPADKMAKTTPAQFIRQVRQEVAKVTWPSRKETIVTTASVFVMVIFAALFFFVVDQIIAYGVKQILVLGG
jgi:preprotein translocase subunit SecE